MSMDLITTIMTFVVDSESYARMQSQDCNGVDDSMQYAAFLDWNLNCLNELDSDELDMVFKLTQMISAKKLNLMDLEPCVAFPATRIYYDINKKLCIVNDQ